MTTILGLSCSHNGSVALIRDGRVLAAIQAERISRRKREDLPLGERQELVRNCVEYCTSIAGIRPEEINAVAITTPWEVKKISDYDLFKYIGGEPRSYQNTFYVPHHLSHAEYILHYGKSKQGIVLVVDGSGSLESDRTHFNVEESSADRKIDLVHFAGKEVISAYWFDGKNVFLIYRFSPSQAPIEQFNSESAGKLQSIGHYWEWASLYCCGSPNEAGKVMGLAALGNNNEGLGPTIMSLDDDGALRVDFPALTATYRSPNIFGEDLSDSVHHQNLASRVQLETEEVLIKLARFLKARYKTDSLYLSGGVALNVVANEALLNSGHFKNIVLNGSVEDNGTAIGAALAVSADITGSRVTSETTDYYGKCYPHEEIVRALGDFDFPFEILSEATIAGYAAELIRKDQIIGWFQGRSEFGPRALGNRSILANPASAKTKSVLDNLMKCRDRYRPYAPVVTEDKASEYFEMTGSSPVMMRNVRVKEERLTAITHIDGTARVQTVNERQNSLLYRLLLEVEKLTGFPILLNTSFNRPGEPIVETPKDALTSFSEGSLDFLIMGTIAVRRQ